MDNGSVDGTAAAARELGAEVLVIPDVRVGTLRNLGAERARTPLIAFVDADHEIAPGWIRAAAAGLTDSRVAGIGAPYSSPPAASWVQRLYDAFRDHRETAGDTSWLGAGNLVVKADVFHQLRGFDTALEACEDVDFCQRLIGAGFVLRAEPRMRSVHYGDPRTVRALFKSELWRGRDNLRVSLRGRLTPGALPSIVIPILDLLAIGALGVGMLLVAPLVIAGALAVFFGLASLRAVIIWRRLERAGVVDLGRAFIVACAYDLARALALVMRAPHRRAHLKGSTPAV